jgi:hypothetical protein
VIEFQMFDPKTAPISVCATKLVPLAANYTTVSMYECGMLPAPGLPERIDPTIVVYDINKTASILNGFDRSYVAYGGYGTPITYLVKSGEVALLPSWYNKTAVAGSRIARIWIIAASDDPSKGPALGTKFSAATVKDDKVSINIYKFERYLVVNFVPNVCPAGWTTQTFLDEFDGSGRIIGLGFGTSGTSTLVLSNYTKVPMWNSTAMWLEGIKRNNVAQFNLSTVALDRLTVKNTADFPIVVGSLTVRYGDDKHRIRISPESRSRVNPGETVTALLDGYGFGRTYMFITYVVKSGEVALLPSWYNKTSVAGSRIARVWIIAASDNPSVGPALGTKFSASTVKDDKVSINIYKFERYLVVNFVPNVCPAGWTTRTFLDEFDGSGRIIGLGFGTSGTSTLVLSNYTKVPMWNSTAMWLKGIKQNDVAQFNLTTVALDALTVKNTADFPIVVDSLRIKYGDYEYRIPMSPLRVDPKQTGTALLNGYGFG